MLVREERESRITPLLPGLSQGVDYGAKHRDGDLGRSLGRRCDEFRLGHNEFQVPMRHRMKDIYLLND